MSFDVVNACNPEWYGSPCRVDSYDNDMGDGAIYRDIIINYIVYID